jgi:bis(5'-nucleosyl)-tetraphosphatase (symmetrical)
MTRYAIGDLQGCYDTLMVLLDKIGFDTARDELWLTGDLVNRGAKSLDCLRFVKSLGKCAICVLGNHDLHLLAVAAGASKLRPGDTLDGVLGAPDCDELLDWLRERPLLHRSDNWVLVHAGIAPGWSPEDAEREASHAARALASSRHPHYLHRMYGNEPTRWDAERTGAGRFRFAVNALTRIRCVDPHGGIEFSFKGEPEHCPPGLAPWYERLDASWTGLHIIAGHWSAAGARQGPGYTLLDSGCVWGRTLTALCLDDQRLHHVACAERMVPAGWD